MNVQDFADHVATSGQASDGTNFGAQLLRSICNYRTAAEKISAMDREIESRQGVGW
jgi:hypothetical protein